MSHEGHTPRYFPIQLLVAKFFIRRFNSQTFNLLFVYFWSEPIFSPVYSFPNQYLGTFTCRPYFGTRTCLGHHFGPELYESFMLCPWKATDLYYKKQTWTLHSVVQIPPFFVSPWFLSKIDLKFYLPDYIYILFRCGTITRNVSF